MKRIPVFILLLISLVVSCAYIPENIQGTTQTPQPSTASNQPSASPSQPLANPSSQQEPEIDDPALSIKIQLAGDILLHTKPVKAAMIGEGTYDFSPYFEKISPYIDGDLSICNVETPIDVFGENKKLSSYPSFNAPYEILPALKEAGFNFFINSNNHSFDKGWSGLKATRANFDKAGVAFTGTYETQEQYDEYMIIDVGGINVGILAYTDAVNGLEQIIPSEHLPYALRRFSSSSTKDVERMIEDMEGCRSAGADFIILSLHWGVEYVNEPSSMQIEIAKLLCAGGADIIMGNHSHCVQPIEWYDGKDGRKSLCVYSLGNFFADQNDMENPIRKTQYGMLLNIVVEKEKNEPPSIMGAEIIPTFAYRYKNQDGSNGYYLLPAGAYMDTELPRPDVFKSDSDWERCRAAFSHVISISGVNVSHMSEY